MRRKRSILGVAGSLAVTFAVSAFVAILILWFAFAAALNRALAL